MKSYDELVTLKTFEERFNYLKCHGKIGDETFGYDRWINQKLYTSQQWRNFRNRIIVRDDGCDMALEDCKIPDSETIIVHHINPITVEDIINRTPKVFDENNVVCVREKTHNAIHYGDLSSLGIIVGLNGDRKENDMIPWKNTKKGEEAVATKGSKREKKYGTVRTALVLNVRSSPDATTNNIIDKLKNGTIVEIMSAAYGNFYKITYKKDIKKVVGYVMKQFIVPEKTVGDKK